MVRVVGWLDQAPAGEVGRLPSIALTVATAGRWLVIGHEARNVLGTVQEDAEAPAQPSQAGGMGIDADADQ
jgi:hypothetical protein